MATVIKASGPVSVANGMSFNLEDMTARANQCLDGVRQQAHDILEQARREADQIRRRAEHEGQQAAIRAVEKVTQEKITRQLATLVPALSKVVESLRDARQEWIDQWEKSALHVACQIAERVIRRELKQQPDVTKSLIREALEMAAGSPNIVLRLHPQDAATLAGHVDELTSEIGRLGKIEFVADASVTAGGCRIETRFGAIDQQIEAQLKRIEEELS